MDQFLYSSMPRHHLLATEVVDWNQSHQTINQVIKGCITEAITVDDKWSISETSE